MAKKNKNKGKNKGKHKKGSPTEQGLADILQLPEDVISGEDGSTTQEEVDDSILDAVMVDVATRPFDMLLGKKVRKLRLADIAILLKADSIFIQSVDDNEDKSISVLEVGKIMLLLDYDLSYTQAYELAGKSKSKLNAKCLECTSTMSFSSVKGYVDEINAFLSEAYASQPIVIDDKKEEDNEKKSKRMLVGEEDNEGKD